MSDYIPPELIPNILARLPVYDVLRCTSVCKSCYSLITCPSFASLHLDLSSPNHEPRVLVKYCKVENRISSYCLHRDNQTFDEIAELDVPVSFRGNEWKIIDSLNGLVCLYGYLSFDIVLWNPSLRKSIILPKSRVLSDSPRIQRRIIGCGFIATSNDYKIVKFSYARKSEPQAEIYQLSTGSWRDLKLEDSLDIKLKSEQAHLNGILHWSARNRGDVNCAFSNFICSFDFKKEKFGTLMLPSCLRRADGAVYFTPSTFEESLCLIDDSFGLCKIWVMKEYGVSDSWQNLFCINTQQPGLKVWLYFRHNGEVIFFKTSGSSGKRKLVSYDCKNNRVKNDELLANCSTAGIYTHVESLVLIKGPTEVKIDEESTNISKNIRGFSGLLLNRMNEAEGGSKIG